MWFLEWLAFKAVVTLIQPVWVEYTLGSASCRKIIAIVAYDWPLHVMWQVFVLMSIITRLAPPHKLTIDTSCTEWCNLITHVACHCGSNTVDKMTISLGTIWLQCINLLCSMHSLCAVQMHVAHVSWIILSCIISVRLARGSLNTLWYSTGTPRYCVCNGCSCVCACHQTTIVMTVHTLIVMCMHVLCACMCKLHAFFQCVLICIAHKWHTHVWPNKHSSSNSVTWFACTEHADLHALSMHCQLWNAQRHCQSPSTILRTCQTTL